MKLTGRTAINPSKLAIARYKTFDFAKSAQPVNKRIKGKKQIMSPM